MKTIKRSHNGEPAGAQPQARITPTNSNQAEVRVSQDAVALQAYLIYVQQGCPQGRDVQHWLDAEAQVLRTREARR